MATPRLRCNLCEQPLTGHCPDSNYTCTWLRCTNSECTAELYDWRVGTLRHPRGERLVPGILTAGQTTERLASWRGGGRRRALGDRAG